MGKGDKKSRRGKIVIGTYGVRRPKKKKKHAITNPIEVESVLSDKLQKKSKKKSRIRPEIIFRFTKESVSRQKTFRDTDFIFIWV